jgi:hypothetical protein
MMDRLTQKRYQDHPFSKAENIEESFFPLGKQYPLV